MIGVVAGVKNLTVNGIQFKTAETATYNVATKVQESLIGGGGRLGRTEKSRAAFIKVKVYLEEGQSQMDIVGVNGAEVHLECADRTVSLTAADECSSAEVDAAENSFEVNFEARSGREVA